MILKGINFENHGNKKRMITCGSEFPAIATIPTIIIKLSVNSFIPCTILPTASKLGFIFKCRRVFPARSSTFRLCLVPEKFEEKYEGKKIQRKSRRKKKIKENKKID